MMDNIQHNNNIITNNRNIFIVVPYSKGHSKRLGKTWRRLGLQVCFRGSNTICNLLVATKDKDSTTHKSWVIYRYKYTQADYEKECIRELSRTFGERLKEHLRALSPICQQSQVAGHPISVDCFTIIGRKAHGFTRAIREALFICINDSSLNRSLGKYQHVHIWDEVLQNTPSLHLR